MCRTKEIGAAVTVPAVLDVWTDEDVRADVQLTFDGFIHTYRNKCEWNCERLPPENEDDETVGSSGGTVLSDFLPHYAKQPSTRCSIVDIDRRIRKCVFCTVCSVLICTRSTDLDIFYAMFTDGSFQINTADEEYPEVHQFD